MGDRARFVVPAGLQRSFDMDDAAIVESARALLEYMPRHLGYDGLAGLHVLDVGCGVKFTRIILEDDIPIGRYVGVDVEPRVIEALREQVHDPRFTYGLADFYNARYNPNGTPMTPSSRLPIPDQTFDIICLFSVFTHLDPDDYRVMLQILRPYVKPEGRLLYTLYIDELTEGGHGMIDQWEQALGPGVAGQTEKYRDFWADDVLRVALYTEDYARELIEDTGWAVVDLQPPIPYAQHRFTLRPV